jgi:hypothetical protein
MFYLPTTNTEFGIIGALFGVAIPTADNAVAIQDDLIKLHNWNLTSRTNWFS